MSIKYLPSVLDLDIRGYPKVKTILFDIDNTLIHPKKRYPTIEVIQFVKQLISDGYEVFLFSNNTHNRIVCGAISFGCKYFESQHKPLAGDLKRYLKYNQRKPEEVLLIGDQVFTDIWCGKKAKVNLILVEQMTKDEPFWVKWKRGLELPFKAYIINHSSK